MQVDNLVQRDCAPEVPSFSDLSGGPVESMPEIGDQAADELDAKCCPAGWVICSMSEGDTGCDPALDTLACQYLRSTPKLLMSSTSWGQLSVAYA